MSYGVLIKKQALKDIKKLTPTLLEKCKEMIRSIAAAPYLGKELTGDLKGYYSKRLTFQDRILYTIDDDWIIVTIIRAKTHYGD